MLGWEPDDEFNEGWREGALPKFDPTARPVQRVYVVGVAGSISPEL